MPDEVELEELRQHLEAARAEIQKLLDLSREGGAPVALDTSIGRLTRRLRRTDRSGQAAGQARSHALCQLPGGQGAPLVTMDTDVRRGWTSDVANT